MRVFGHRKRMAFPSAGGEKGPGAAERDRPGVGGGSAVRMGTAGAWLQRRKKTEERSPSGVE